LKPVLVLVVSILIFAGAAFLVNNDLMDYVQTHLYNPSIVKTIINENHKDAEFVQNHIFELQTMFANVLNEPAIRSSFLYNQSAEDIYERSRVFGILLETISGLQYIQFVDSNGIRLHYSTSSGDVISQSRESASYRNYVEDPKAMPYELVSVPDNGNAKFTMDDSHDRIIFSYPFYDSMDVYRGTALFTLSVRAFADKLVAEGRLKPNDDMSVIRIPPGVVLGSPDSSKPVILDKVSSAWSEGLQNHVTLDAEGSGVRYALISTKTLQNLFFGRLINDSIFAIPDQMKKLLYFSMFLTFYLSLLFILNIKPNPVILVRNRIKTLRSNLFEQLYVNKTSQERAKWILELEQRREEIRAELKNNLKLKSKTEKTIDSLIDKAWDELLAVIKSGSGQVIPAEEQKKIQAKPPKAKKAEMDSEGLEEIDEIEEVEEAETLEEIDEIEEVEEAEALEEIDEIEEVEEAEALEEIDEIEEVEEAEALEEIDEIEEAEEAEALEEIDEIEEVEEAEALEEIGEIEEVEKAAPEETVNFEAPIHKSGRGLLELASKIEEEQEIQKDEVSDEAGKFETHTHTTGRGLLELASKIEEEQEIMKNAVSDEAETFESLSHAPTGRGLLELASKIEEKQESKNAVAAEETKDFEELEELEEIEAVEEKPPAPKGLPSAEDEEDDGTVTHSSKGLLALASEIEFGQAYPVSNENEEDLNTELDIVSPFSSMFSSLDDNDKENTE
jgi:hypothetical protein